MKKCLGCGKMNENNERNCVTCQGLFDLFDNDDEVKNMKIINEYIWMLDYDMLAMDIGAWLASCGATPSELDRELGFANFTRALVNKARPYGQHDMHMLMGNFLLLCTYCDLEPANYFVIEPLTWQNMPQRRGKRKNGG